MQLDEAWLVDLTDDELELLVVMLDAEAKVARSYRQWPKAVAREKDAARCLQLLFRRERARMDARPRQLYLT